MWSIDLHTRTYQCMTSDGNECSVKERTIGIHKYMLTQTDAIAMITMKRRANNGSSRKIRY
ncbi:hypothetical protein M084_4534, partial [Bacteroides fragilis str. 3988 T1]